MKKSNDDDEENNFDNNTISDSSFFALIGRLLINLLELQNHYFFQ